jgi:hypothetical protein
LLATAGAASLIETGADPSSGADKRPGTTEIVGAATTPTAAIDGAVTRSGGATLFGGAAASGGLEAFDFATAPIAIDGFGGAFLMSPRMERGGTTGGSVSAVAARSFLVLRRGELTAGASETLGGGKDDEPMERASIVTARLSARARAFWPVAFAASAA